MDVNFPRIPKSCMIGQIVTPLTYPLQASTEGFQYNATCCGVRPKLEMDDTVGCLGFKLHTNPTRSYAIPSTNHTGNDLIAGSVNGR